MDLDKKCPRCHVVLSQNIFYCFNCGKKIKDKPLSTSVPRQIFIYFCSFFLAPMGFSYGIKYLRQNGASKIIGIICILLSFAAITLSFLFIARLLNTVNSVTDGGKINDEGLINEKINNGTNSEIYNQFQNQIQDIQRIKEFENSDY